MIEKVADVWREACYGVRLLRKNPGYTLIIGLTFALGIGATTAIFSVLYASVLSPLPFSDPDRLVMIEQRNAQGRGRPIPVAQMDAWRTQTQTLDVAAYALMGVVNATLSGSSGAERLALEQVDFRTFEVLGVKPLLGRWYQPDEVIVQGNTAQTIVISYGLWQRVFGGDPNVIGKKLPGWTAGWGEIVIGVMPKGFYTHPGRSGMDAWYVITRNPGPVIARLKKGIRPEQAQAELAALGRQDPPSNGAPQPDNTWMLRVAPLQQAYRGDNAETVYLLLGAVVFVLLIASVNVANLQLNRSIQRQTEMAARIALGAGRWRLVRQLVVENVILAIFGGIIGLLVAVQGISLFVLLAPNFYPPSEEIRLNGPVLLFAIGVCLAAGILSGLFPGFRGSNPDLSASLKEGGRGVVGRTRFGIRRLLVVSEFALAMVLLVGAGLMINSYARLTSVHMGLDPKNVLTMEVNLFGIDRFRVRRAPNQWTAKPEMSNFYTSALERLARVPGVQSVALISGLPPRGSQAIPFNIIGGAEGAASERPVASYHEVSPALFETMQIPLVRGRPFTDLDNENAPGVVIINETFARQYFGNENPIGRSIQARMNAGNPNLQGDRAREIVGVVKNVRQAFQADFTPDIYVPYRQSLTDYESNFLMTIHALQEFVVRTSGNPENLAATVRRAVAEADNSVAIINMMSMQDRLSTRLAGEQEFWMRLLGIFAGLGMFLAAIGVYGVISYTVEQRTHEFGIRATLGARDSDILRLVLREAFFVILPGLAIGIAGTYGATRLIAKQLFGVTPMDPATIAAVAVVLVAVAFLACYIPARRATKLDPLSALRVS